MYDIAIIGAGVVGCAVLNKLTELGKKCIIIEKQCDVSLGASRANSGLVHAGFDCEEGTLKAKLNIEGNKLYPELCKRLFVPYLKTGAIVVGSDIETVKQLYSRGIYNGANDLYILNREEILKLVPNIADNITCGLYAKSAGIVSPYELTIALAEEAVINGAEFRFNYNINKINYINDFFEITNNKERIICKQIVNAAGDGYNDVAKLIGSEEYEIKFKRGEYFIIDKAVKNLVNLTVFPLPDKNSKGVLITPTTDGVYLLGPTSYESDSGTETTRNGLNYVTEKVKQLINNIPFNKVIRTFAGVRATVGGDFVIEKSKYNCNVINLAGICSPGLTSAPAIANLVADLLNINEKNKISLKSRKPITKTSELNTEQLNSLIKRDNKFGKIICKCEHVTEAEIIEALNSPLKPNSVDAIKRRVRAGMGRCQGGFCFVKVIETIASHLNIPLNSVTKENAGSNFICSDIFKGGEEC